MGKRRVWGRVESCLVSRGVPPRMAIKIMSTEVSLVLKYRQLIFIIYLPSGYD